MTAPMAFLTDLAAPTPCATQPCLFDASDEASAERAVDLCLDCPLMIPCRDWARLNGISGVVGGETDEERLAWRLSNADRGLVEKPRPEHGTAAGAKWHRRNSPDRKPCAACLTAETTAARERVHTKATELRGTPLRPAELRVLQALAAGATRQDAADQLGIKRRGLDKYVWFIRQRLGAQDFITAARDQGLIPAAIGEPPLRAVPAADRSAA